MKTHVKALFLHCLEQLEHLTKNIPAEHFDKSLNDNMFCLAIQAKIATNFVLRGYCPLLRTEIVSFDQDSNEKAAIVKQIRSTIEHLAALPEVTHLDETVEHSEKAGFAMVALPQPAFIHQYILPNLHFHMSMIYAIARCNGVMLSKGDYDGFHQYPSGFSFTHPTED